MDLCFSDYARGNTAASLANHTEVTGKTVLNQTVDRTFVERRDIL